MSTPLVTIQIDGMEQLERAVQDFRALVKDDSGKILAKGARLVTLSLHREFRKSPPRPTKGRISAEAESRGFRLSRRSRSFVTGLASAKKILGSHKSGYFRISEGRATPILIGPRGKILRPRSRSKRASLLTNVEQLKGKELPADAVQLNTQALATMRAINLREKAAAGGYLSSQFLSYKGVRNIGESKFSTKDRRLAGSVIVKADAEGDAVTAQITGFLEGGARIAQREGIINRSLAGGAAIMRQDMAEAINRRGAAKFGRRS